jgi:2-aminoethylphosphonate-pyruvate transaminase
MVQTKFDKLLFTPGPLTTSREVKEAMLCDAGSWHFEFIEIVTRIRTDLLALAGVTEEFEAVLLPGSGTYGVESVVSSTVPKDGELLVLVNGAYGERIVRMAELLNLAHHVLRYPEDCLPCPRELDCFLAEHQAITSVALVHCETTTGILNPIREIGQVVKSHRREFIVDAMSSFGALDISFAEAGIDYLISSANKCIEGVPGFCFVIARRAALLKSHDRARSLSLSLYDQWMSFVRNGQFRFTPPTHTILAFSQALNELAAEGGVSARGRRYSANHQTLLAGMSRFGFKAFLPPGRQSCVITAFHCPQYPAFNFNAFYRGLSDRGMIIYPGKLTQVDTFRIGTIGRLYPTDVERLLQAIQATLNILGCPIPLPG